MNTDGKLMEKLEELDAYKPSESEIGIEVGRLDKFQNGTIAWYRMAQDGEVSYDIGGDGNGLIAGPTANSLVECWLLMWHGFDQYNHRQRGYKDVKIGPFYKIARMPFGPDYQHRQNPVAAAEYYLKKTDKSGNPFPWHIVDSNGPQNNPRQLLWMKPTLRDGVQRVTVNMSDFMHPFPRDWASTNVICRKKMDAIRTHRALNNDQREEVRQLVSATVQDVMKAISSNKLLKKDA